MKICFVILLYCLTFSVLASTRMTSQIKDIDYSATPYDTSLIFLSNGRIVKTSIENSILLKQLNKSMLQKDWVELTINEQREIESYEVVNDSFLKTKRTLDIKSVDGFAEGYNPSILKSLDQARAIFYDAKINNKESQCYNRAHVWAYDWRIKYNLYSTKIWIYFTRKYIREFDFEWWFHVSPVVHVVTDGTVKERVMDIKYAKGPLKIKQWTDIFMKNDAACPVVDRYTDQANYPESGYCFLMKSSMYYYQPVDLDALEQKGTIRNRWVESEVKHAFEEAFDIIL